MTAQLPVKARIKLSDFNDAEVQARNAVNDCVRRLSETQRAFEMNAHGDNAADVEFELSRLRSKLPQMQTQHNQWSALNTRIRQWLADLDAASALTDAKPPKVKLKPGQTASDAVAAVREEIAVLIAERLDVEQAGLPLDELKAQARKWVTQRQMKGRLHIRAGHREGFEVAFETDGFAPKLDVLAFLTLYDPDGTVKLIERELERMPKPKLALTPAERESRLSDLSYKLLDLERREERLIELAADDLTFIPRRPHASPTAILGIVVTSKVAVTA